MIRVLSQMRSFQYYFGVKLRQLIFGTVTISAALCSTGICQQSVAALTVTILQSICTDEMFNLFWEKVQKECEKINVEEATLPRARKHQNGMKLVKVIPHILTVLRFCTALLTLKDWTLL